MEKTIVISCSMKYCELIKSTIEEFKKYGIEAIFPNLDENNGNVEDIEIKNKFAQEHYDVIKNNDKIYFILPSGYMGTSCKLEPGYAIALEKEIFFSEFTNDIGLDSYPKDTISINELGKFSKYF